MSHESDDRIVEQPPTSPLPVAQGHRYGDVVIYGQNASVMLGNNYTGNKDLFEVGTQEQRRRIVLNLLYYDGLGVKREQLSLINTTAESFDWVEQTEFPSWLCDLSSMMFWILGKPGSGKSTVMKHLADSNSTYSRLMSASQSQRWYIVHFFFDYRAARATANSVLGMLKQFLRQLILDVPFFHDYVQRWHNDIGGANLDLFIDILAKGINEANVSVCAFIDGLDEYEDNLVDLCSILENLQARTGMKMCLASRPETPFEETLARLKCPSIIMQDYNTAAIAASVRHKIARFDNRFMTARNRLTEELQQLVVTRADGVILWASLVVDEMIQECHGNDSADADDLIRLLNTIPSGLNPLYDRILARAPLQYHREIALILELITDFEEHVPASLRVEELAQACRYSEIHFMQIVHKIDLDTQSYPMRLKALLGNMIDMVPFGDTQVVRTFHKSFSTYLARENWTKSRLPTDFHQHFPNNIWKRLAVEIICAAESESAMDTTACLSMIRGDIPSKRPELLPTLGWNNWRDLLHRVITDFFLIGPQPSKTAHTTLKFPHANDIALVGLIASDQVYSVVKFDNFISAPLCRLHQKGVFDLVFRFFNRCTCIDLDLARRLTEMDQESRNDLFDVMIVFVTDPPTFRDRPSEDLVLSWLQIFALHDCRLDSRHVCFFSSKRLHSRTVKRIFQGLPNIQPGTLSDRHGPGCPNPDFQAPLVMHWIHSEGEFKGVLSLADLLRIGLDLDRQIGNFRDIFHMIFAAVQRGDLHPKHAEVKFLEACRTGARPCRSSANLDLARHNLALARRATHKQNSARSWIRRKLIPKASDGTETVLTLDHVAFYSMAVADLGHYRDYGSWPHRDSSEG